MVFKIILSLVLAGVVVSVGAVWYYKIKSQNPTVQDRLPPVQTTNRQPLTQQPQIVAEDGTDRWKTYKNKERSVEFMYPPDWIIRLVTESSSTVPEESQDSQFLVSVGPSDKYSPGITFTITFHFHNSFEEMRKEYNEYNPNAKNVKVSGFNGMIYGDNSMNYKGDNYSYSIDADILRNGFVNSFEIRCYLRGEDDKLTPAFPKGGCEKLFDKILSTVKLSSTWQPSK